jgi:hypothetical protein
MSSRNVRGLTLGSLVVLARVREASRIGESTTRVRRRHYHESVDPAHIGTYALPGSVL